MLPLPRFLSRALPCWRSVSIALFAALWCADCVAQQGGGEQDPPAQAEEEEFDLSAFGGLEESFLFAREGEVESVTKRRQDIRDVPATIDVLTGDAIRRSGLRNVGEMLRRLPGTYVAVVDSSSVEFAARGTFGSGIATVLTLVDNVSYYDDFYGANRLYSMPYLPSEIDRLEWVRGAGAAIYGANASRGALSIFTRSPRDTGTYFTSGFGERDSHYTDVVSSFEVGESSFLKVVAGIESFDGYRDLTGGTRQADNLTRQMGKVTWLRDFGEDTSLQLEAAFINLDDNTTRNLSPVPLNEEVSTFRGRLDGPSYYIQFGAQHAASEGSLTTPFETSRTTLDLDSRYNFIEEDGNVLFGGLNLRMVDVNDTGLISRRQRNHVGSLYLHHERDLSERLRGAVGMRLEDGEQSTGVIFLPRASLTYGLNDEHSSSLRMSYGRTASTRSFIEEGISALLATGLPFPSQVRVQGDPELREEIRDSVELSYTQSLGESADLVITGFHDWFQNPIATELRAGIPPVLQFVNRENGTVAGVEAQVRWLASEDLSTYLSYTYLDAHRSFNSQGTSPQNSVTLGFAYDATERLSIALDGAWYGSRTNRDFAGETPFADDEYFVTGRASYRPKWVPGEFGVNVSNLFNARQRQANDGVIVGSTVTVDYRIDF